MDVNKLLKAGKDYAKSQMTPENLLKASNKIQGKQKNPNNGVSTTQETTPTAQPIEQASTMGKYMPYIVGGLLLVVVVFFVMKKK